MDTVKTLSLKNVKKMFVADSVRKPKNHTCNDAIIKIIDLINDEQKTITCEVAKGGEVLNRGSVVECLVKLYLLNNKSASKYQQNRQDIILNDVGYEIKYTNSVAYASISNTQKKAYLNKEYKPLILVDAYGIYLSNTQYYLFANNGKVKGVKRYEKVLVSF